jgi:hypothetical protein
MTESWITVATYYQHLQAGLAKSALDAAGIACWLRDEHVELYGALAPVVFGGIKLQVRPGDEAAALEILGQDASIVGAEFPSGPDG